MSVTSHRSLLALAITVMALISPTVEAQIASSRARFT
jgi:hypothetical protein